MTFRFHFDCLTLLMIAEIECELNCSTFPILSQCCFKREMKVIVMKDDVDEMNNTCVLVVCMNENEKNE